MLVSSTSMKAAMATTTAMSQGLYFGRQGSSGTESTSALPDIDFAFHRHAGSQPMVIVLVGIDIDPDRDALHYLHEISRGIFRGQQAEARTACAANTGDLAAVLTAISVNAEGDSIAWLHQP